MLSKLIGLALPMMFGIIAVLSVSLVDTYFVGRLGTNPLAALSFTFPVTLAVSSLSIGLGAGAASVVSRAIGASDRDDAKALSTAALCLSVLIVIAISTLGYFTIRPLFSLLGAQGEVLDMIVRYMRIWYMTMPFLVVPMVANAIIRAVGDAFWPSLIMVGAAVVNIATTPAFIFGFGPVPALDIEGAAWGTFVARFTTLIFALYIIIKREKLVDFTLPPIRELMSSWWRVLKVAVPAALGNMTNPVGIAVVTAIIAGYSASTVAAFGVATRVESFACIPMLALSSAIGPMAGQNWGAEQKDRVVRALILSYGMCVIWAVVLTAVLWILGPSIAGIFASDATVADEAARYLKIVPMTLWGYGVVIIGAGAFNALGKSVTGFAFYLTRTALLYVPLSFIGSLLAGSEAVYIGIALSNALAGATVAGVSLWWLKNHTPTSD